MQNRGALAWDNVEAGSPVSTKGVNRLLLHGITDESNRQYMNAVYSFL